MKTTFIAIGGLLLCTQALAGEAHVCRSQPHAMNTPENLSDETEFVCSDNLKGTIPQLAHKGWRIIQVTQQTSGARNTDVYHEIVIEKP